jgi:chromate reductase
MSKSIKIVAFSGSTRKDSYNKKLLLKAISFLPKNIELTLIDLKDYPMPFYDGDFEKENGIPENAKKLRNLMSLAGGFIIATPEYNGGISAVLKNAIDWTSRGDGEVLTLSAYKGKFALLLSTSAGKFGGVRSLSMLRSILEYMGTTVLAEEITIPFATKVFNGEEVNILESDLKLMEDECKNLVSFLA